MEESNTKKKLLAMLGTLGVLAVVLVAAIFIITGLGKEPEAANTYPSTIHTEELSEINAKADEMTIEDAKLLYEDVIEKAATELDREQTRVEYGRYLMRHNLIEDGLNKLLNTNDEVLETNYKMILYATLRDYFSSINNDELANEYNEKIGEAIKDSDYAAGG